MTSSVLAAAGLRVFGLAAAAALWWWAAPHGHPFWPRPEGVWRAAIDLWSSGVLPRDWSDSARRVLIGVGLACAAAGALALIGALIPRLDDALDGVFTLFRSVPPIALTPLALVMFGVGDAPAAAIVAFGAFFPIWMGLRQGRREIDPDHLRAARSLGAGLRLRLTDVILPSLAPYALHGLRIGVGLGWFSVVAAEMMGAGGGLGYGVNAYGLNLETERCFLYILLIGLSGVLSDAVLGLGRGIGAQ